MRKKLLIYTQDVGGTRCILPLLQVVQKDLADLEILYVPHPLSEDVFRSRSFEPTNLRNISCPLTEERCFDFLKKEGITHLFCTLSSPYFDPTNCHLIKAARRSGIPT